MNKKRGNLTAGPTDASESSAGTACGARRNDPRPAFLFAKRVAVLLAALAIGYLAGMLLPADEAARRSREAVAHGSVNSRATDELRALVYRDAKHGLSDLRVRFDAARERLWVLELDQVTVYDTKRRTRIHRVVLPSWPVADFICGPDLALDPAGHAFISNNVRPVVVQIDLDNVQTIEHHLDMVPPTAAEVGFGALRSGDGGALFGVSALGGTLWRIDLSTRTAKQVRDAEIDQCEVPAPQWLESRMHR